MSTATWGEPQSETEEQHPLELLKQLLQQMMKQFAANGACLALYDETIGQMVVRLHLRTRSSALVPNQAQAHIADENTIPLGMNRRNTINLADSSASNTGRMRRLSQPLQPLQEAETITSVSDSTLFPVGAAYAYGQDLIGYTWRKNAPEIMRHEDYLLSIRPAYQSSPADDITPTWYLATPIHEPPLTPQLRGRRRSPGMIGIVVLYQAAPGPGFQQKQRAEAIQFAERIALYIQNDRLQRLHLRTSDYMKRLQQISTAFPSAVKLSKLVEDVYQFVTGIVNISSMLLTFYDRDTNKLYDVFAIDNGRRLDELHERPVITDPQERPTWWLVTQVEKRTLLFSPTRQEPEDYGKYEELLKGTWGDQSKAGTFLLLPMKMFTRVIGSLCLSSTRPDAYSPEEIQVLETMVQIITVSIENARLYDRSRRALLKAKQREESLATMNSALQAISTVLNVNELLRKFVETVANLVQAEMCTFFQLSPNQQELVAEAIYDRTGQWKETSSVGTQFIAPNHKDTHDELIEMIRLPFKNSLLGRLVESDAFFYLDSTMAEELAQASGEGGALFLRETHIQKMLMIPVRYQAELVGILAVHTPRLDRIFRPEEVSTLLAISAQAASAIRNAQLFAEIREANVELQRMDKLKDEFIVTASHEFRTPLSAISGYASLLRRQNARLDSQQILRYASKIAGAAQQLSDLVANMTEAAKMGSLGKKLELQLGPVQLRAAADMAAHMLSVNIEQKIIVDISPDLWVYCDALPLRQVITNLLDNAAKYSPPTGRITIAASPTSLSRLPEDQVDYRKLANGDDLHVVLVRVCDEGDGIPLEDQEKIFEKFVRASRSLTTPVRGTGLGLYICRRYIEAMGGRIWLEVSIPGEGSVFSFYLPRIDPPPEAKELHESPFPAT